MRNLSKLFTLLVLLLVVFCYIQLNERGLVKAQQPTTDTYYKVSCFSAKHCEDDADSNCIVGWESDGSAKITEEDHMAQLTLVGDEATGAYGLAPSQETFVTECFSKGVEEICTTGSDAHDRTLFNIKDGDATPLQRIRSEIDSTYTFDNNPEEDGDQAYGMYEIDTAAKVRSYRSNANKEPQPITSKADGNLNLLQWKSYTEDNQPRKFKAWNKVTVVITPPPTGNPDNGNNGNVGGQQQGDLPFPSPTNVPPPSTIVPGCTEVIWDPEGRVFDAKTLEPIAGARVVLSRKHKTGSPAACANGTIVGDTNIDKTCTPATSDWREVPPSSALKNPQFTKADGQFNFFVGADRFYQLDVTMAGYTFPIASVSEVNPLYSWKGPDGVAMYRQLYTATNREIYQVAKTEHRDIPIIATGASATSKIVASLFPVSTPDGKWVVTGTVSHPLATIEVYTKDPTTGQKKKLVGTYSADSRGRVNISLNQKTLAPDVLGIIEVKPFDYTRGQAAANTNSNVLGVLAQANSPTSSSAISMTVEPIPTYLEGFAYDSTGKIIPYAKVGVYLSYSKNAFYQTMTNSDGSFRIASEYLPNTQFSIRFTDPQGKVNNVTTSQFIVQKSKQVPLSTTATFNPFASVAATQVTALNAQEGRVIADLANYYQAGNAAQNNQQNGTGNNGEAGTKTVQNPPNNAVLIAVILLLLLGAVGVMLAVYIYRKNAAQPTT